MMKDRMESTQYDQEQHKGGKRSSDKASKLITPAGEEG